MANKYKANISLSFLHGSKFAFILGHSQEKNLLGFGKKCTK